MLIYKQKTIGILLVIPIIALLLLVIGIPEVLAIGMSMTDFKPGAPINFVGLSNFKRILSDPNFINSFWTTLKFVVFGVATQMILGTLVALLLSRQFLGQKLWLSLILAPMAMSPALLGTTWKYLLNTEFGPINYAMLKLGMTPIYWFTNSTYAFLALIIVYTWNQIPGVFILIYPSIISVPKELKEAAEIDGANKLQVFSHVIFPFIRSALLIALIFRTVIALRAFGEILVLTKGGPFRATEVLSIFLYKEGFVYFNWGTSAAVGVVILLVTIVVASPQIRLLARQMILD